MPKGRPTIVPDTSIQPKYGRLVVDGEAIRVANEKGYRRWFVPFKCDCGTEKLILWSDVKFGKTKSCGCLGREMISAHRRRGQDPNAKCRDRIWQCWRSIIKRCYNPKYQSFAHYGARGIEMCPEWRNSYETFRDWAINSGYEPHLTIERIDVNGHYCPANCTWIPKSQQSRNRTVTRLFEYQGESKLVKEWFADPRCKASSWATIFGRMAKGWTFEKALTTPSDQRRIKKKTD